MPHSTGKSSTHFVLHLFLCVWSGKNPKTPNMSPMADDAITQGGIQGLVSPVYNCGWVGHPHTQLKFSDCYWRENLSTRNNPYCQQTKTSQLTTWVKSIGTQQDYYSLQYRTPLHSYCSCTYTEVTALLLWSICTVTMQCLHNYKTCVGTLKVTVVLLQRSSTTTSV